MRVFLYGKPIGPWGTILSAFGEGIFALEEDRIWRSPNGFTMAQTEDADVVVMVGLRGNNSYILKAYSEIDIPALVIDCGYIDRDNYYQIGLNRINWLPPKSCPDDRFKELGHIIKRKRTNGSHVLVCGQRDGDAQHSIDVKKWAESTIKKLKGLTDRKIVWRPHPGSGLHDMPLADETSLPKHSSLSDDLRGAHALVTHNSNSAHEALLSGVPVFCGENAIYASVSNTDLHDIESPKLPARSKYFYKLAYGQWTLDEMRAGTPLSFMAEEFNGTPPN